MGGPGAAGDGGRPRQQPRGRHQPCGGQKLRTRAGNEASRSFTNIPFYWFICTIKQDILQITVLYHVGSPVDEPP